MDKKSLPEGFMDIDRALGLSRQENRDNHSAFINPELVKMVSLLDFDKRFVRAEGVSLFDDEGREYLDFLGGYGALNVGHNHPAVLAAAKKVAGLPNLLQAALNPLAGALARNLALLTPGDLAVSFFGNSGAEAVEAALKLARASTGKTKIISCEGSFHGKTMGALSVTGREKYRRPFQPLLPDVSFVPFGDEEALRDALAHGGAAAFIIEPIQGEGGIIVPPDGYLRRCRELCSAAGALLIADEIQTGFGRTGSLFACQYENVVPDILCLSKSLGGGLAPISACVTSETVWKAAYGSLDKATLHTSTFGGNTHSVAAALAALEVICTEKLSERSAELGAYLLDKLRHLAASHSLIKEVRGRGLFIGLEIRQPQDSLLNRLTSGTLERMAAEYSGGLVAGELMNRHGILTAYTLNNPSVIRLEPPLTVSREQIDRLLEALEDVFKRHKGLAGLAVSSGRTAVGSLLGRR